MLMQPGHVRSRSPVGALALAFDAKDHLIWSHTRRVQIVAGQLAEALGIADLNLLAALKTAALLHDIGKVAVPSSILNKPGRLSAGEYDTVKCHASIGAEILSAIEFPQSVVSIVRHHHENWDGQGYPAGLAGTQIPAGARILAVADCFDALTSDRPYRPKLSCAEALEELQARCGTTYDPSIVSTFAKRCREIIRDVEEVLTHSGLTAPPILSSSIVLIQFGVPRAGHVGHPHSAESLSTRLLAAMRRRLRASDVAFACGPSELVVLFSATSPEIASEIANRVLLEMNAAGLVCRAQYSVASTPSDGESLQALIAAARARLEDQTAAPSEIVSQWSNLRTSTAHQT